MGVVLGFPGVDPADAAVGARLKRWREARGVTVDDLAQVQHVSLRHREQAVSDHRIDLPEEG